ncbi:MAG: hypothetical protein NZ954_01940 [Thermofilaceae archaeon]|nr:hypothetical protein [Thermofilaceae archaeon]MDW8003433.1 hypothetical protein [Thermofilaceae archaeon]
MKTANEMLDDRKELCKAVETARKVIRASSQLESATLILLTYARLLAIRRARDDEKLPSRSSQPISSLK